MINKSISYRLSVFISLAVILVFVAFIIVSYVFDKNLLKENIEHEAITESSKVILQVKKQVVSTQEIANNISDQILYYGAHKDADIFIKTILNKYSYLNGIHINIDSGVSEHLYSNYVAIRLLDSIAFYPKSSAFYHCDNERRKVKEVLNTGAPGWTEPYRCYETEKIIASYICPIQVSTGLNEKKRVGEVICELSLMDLEKFIDKVDIGESKSGYGFLVSKKGDYIAHPNKDWILKRNLYTLSDSVIDKQKVDIHEILTNDLSGITTAFSDFFDYQKSWIYYTSIKETGWLLVFVVPYDELFQPLYRMVLQLLFFSAVGILVIFFIITFITGKLVEPLSVVTSQLKRFSNLSGEATIDTLNEVKLVSESLDYLKNWYESYKVEQSNEEKRSTRIMQDLEQASEIQQSLIRTNFESFSKENNILLHALYKPARVVSGDLFDYFFIDKENLVFTIGDVSGKGIPAAIFMSVAQTIIKGSTTVKRAKNIVQKANSELFTNNQHQFFLTLFVGVLNVKTGILNYCNAAHTSTLILKKEGKLNELSHSHGLPLGLYPDKTYSDKKLQIEKGDTLILYSDGITELQNAENEQLGLERFKKYISEAFFDTPKELVKELEKKLVNFQGEANQVDDITLFIIQY